MAMNVGAGKGSMSDINITPYIDILLVLLIIFMVITPIRQMDLDVKVPQPPPPDAEQISDPSVIVVSISETAQIAVNQEPTLISELGLKLQEIYAARANKNMFVQADNDLPFGDVIRVIDIAKGSGVGDVGLMVE